MAKCPKCKSKLPFFEVLTFSRRKPSIPCPSCNATVKAIFATSGTKGIFIGGTLGALTMWHKEIFGGHPNSLLFAVLASAGLLIGYAFFHVATIKLKVDEDDTTEEKENP